jgi:HEAT repeat protein
MEDNNLQEKNQGQNNILGEITRILIDLLKTIKVVSVYPEDNPLPAKLRETFIERFADMIEKTGGLKFTFTKGEIHYTGVSVYIDRPPDDMLAAIFHDSGITRISFSPEFGFDEANLFFKAMKSFVNKEEGAEDLVATLWQANISGFDYATLEDITMGEYDGDIAIRETGMDDSSGFDVESDTGGLQYSSIFLDDESGGVELSSAKEDGLSGDVGEVVLVDGDGSDYVPVSGNAVESGAVILEGDAMPIGPSQGFAENQMGMVPAPDKKRISLPDTALILNDSFSMGGSELEQASKILADDEQLDILGGVADLLMEMLMQENEYSTFSETVTITEKIQAEFIKMGDLNSAGAILSHLGEVDQLLPDGSIQWKERIRNALIMAGGWEKLANLAATLNSNSSILAEEIIDYLSHFGWESISAIMDLLGELEHRHHRLAIVDHLIETGKDHVDIISKGIFDRRWFVVRNTALILGEIGNDRALTYLEKAIRHDDPRIRQELIKGLTKSGDIKNVNILIRLLWDADVLGKQMILKIILDNQYEEGLNAIVRIINDDRFITLDDSEQEQLVLAFSKTGGEHAVDYLSSLISELKFANIETRKFYHKLAFKALSYNSSDKAEKALQKYARSRKSNLSKMANGAIRLRNNILAKSI